MYQLIHDYTDDGTFRQFVQEIKGKVAEKPGSTPLFHVHCDSAKRDLVEKAVATIGEELPDALYMGCSTSGNISNGAFDSRPAPNLTVHCDVFEDPTTKIEVHQFPLDDQHRDETADALVALVEEKPWVKAVGMLTIVIDVQMEDFCKRISGLRDGVVLFGAGALCTEDIDIFTGLPYVCSSAGNASGHAIVFALYGGESFHALTQAVIGWKPIGKPLEITRAKGPVIYELDGKPAYELYRHYLKIENDEHFSDNSLLFPLAIDNDGVTVIKAPVRVGDDGSLTLTSHIADAHQICRMAYGDPATILHNIKESTQVMRDFAPQGIIAYSCAARLMYWGPKFISRETLPFNSIAPVVGFYSGGEFERHRGKVLHHNVTLVIVGIREGEPADVDDAVIAINETEFSRQMAIVNSLAALVSATSTELESAYYKMRMMAKVDGLTGICNRREIESHIEKALSPLSDAGRKVRAARVGGYDFARPCVIMLDIDDFKKVNDVHGHKAGDDVLRGLGGLLRKLVDEEGVGISGRWGGEEFMVLLGHGTLGEAQGLAERIRAAFSEIDFPDSGRHTVSVGTAQALEDETPDQLCHRVDTALYEAKKQGKNRVVTA